MRVFLTCRLAFEGRQDGCGSQHHPAGRLLEQTDAVSKRGSRSAHDQFGDRGTVGEQRVDVDAIAAAEIDFRGVLRRPSRPTRAES